MRINDIVNPLCIILTPELSPQIKYNRVQPQIKCCLIVLQQQESPPMIEETPLEPAVKYEVLDVVEEDIDDSSAVRGEPSQGSWFQI